MPTLRDRITEVSWHFTPNAAYGLLGWFQHALRLLAILVALFSWIQFIIDGERSKAELRELTVPRWAEVAVLCLLLALHLWKALLVVISAEVLGAAIHALLVLADVMLLLDVILQFDPSVFVFLFALCNALGEILQILYLFMRSKEHLTTHYHLSTTTLWVYSVLAALLYIILLIVQVVIYTTTYQKFHGY